MKWNPFKFLKRSKLPILPGSKKKWTWKRFGRLVLYAILAVFFLVAITFAWFAKDLPTPNKIRAHRTIEGSQIFDMNGKLLYNLQGDERRTVIKSDEIPKTVKDA